jgi:O-antigen/teichoic acid export membrane protein
MALNTQAVRGVRLIRTFAMMQLMPTLTLFVFLLAGLLLTQNHYVPIYAQLAAFTVTALAGAWIMDRAFKAKMEPGDHVRAMSVQEILTISTPMLMTASIHFVIGQIGIVMLGMFRSEAEVGYYSIAVKLATLTAFVLQAINSIAAPKFSELYHTGKMDELFYVAQKATKLIFWATAPILVGLIIFGRPILALMFGKDFVVSYVPMVMLVTGQFISSVSGSTGNFMNMTGHQNPFRTIVFCAGVLSLVLGFILIPRFGINGAACVAMVSVSTWNICTVVFIKRKFGRTIGYLPWLILK